MSRFFDTNVLLYAYGRRDLRKRELANALIEAAIAGDEFVVSTQVLVEFYQDHALAFWDAPRICSMGAVSASSRF